MDDDRIGLPNKQKLINYSIISLFFMGIFILAVGVGLILFKNNSKNSDIQIIEASPVSAVGSEILVDVGGEVIKPGLYHLADGARVDEAIRAAGGMTVNADQTNVNLAAKIHDGQRIYIQSQNAKGKSQNNGSGESGNLVDINNASAAELDTLPGVGPATAAKIISLRPYSSSNDLVSKKAVSASVFEKIKDLIIY